MEITEEHFEAMIEGKQCKFWNDSVSNAVEGKIAGIDMPRRYHFMNEDGTYYENCKPINTEIFFKSKIDLCKLFAMGEYYEDEDEGLTNNPDNPRFVNAMWRDAGKPKRLWRQSWSYLPEWVVVKEI